MLVNTAAVSRSNSSSAGDDTCSCISRKSGESPSRSASGRETHSACTCFLSAWARRSRDGRLVNGQHRQTDRQTDTHTHTHTHTQTHTNKHTHPGRQAGRGQKTHRRIVFHRCAHTHVHTRTHTHTHTHTHLHTLTHTHTRTHTHTHTHTHRSSPHVGGGLGVGGSDTAASRFSDTHQAASSFTGESTQTLLYFLPPNEEELPEKETDKPAKYSRLPVRLCA